MRSATFKVVSVLDPALDTANQLTLRTVLEYQRTRDYALVDGKWVVGGDKPQIFHCKEIPHRYWSYVLGGGSSDQEGNLLPECAIRAFRAGVFRVENAYGTDGVAVANWEPVTRDQFDKSPVMSDEEATRFAMSDQLEIGAVVYQHSFLARRIACTFPLPSSVLGHLVRRTFLLVDKNPSSAEATSSGEHSAETALQTAATATTTESSAAVSG